jgi:hypothetical protein
LPQAKVQRLITAKEKSGKTFSQIADEVRIFVALRNCVGERWRWGGGRTTQAVRGGIRWQVARVMGISRSAAASCTGRQTARKAGLCVALRRQPSHLRLPRSSRPAATTHPT